MGMDMAPTDSPIGLMPYGPVLRANLYAVVTNPTIAVSVGVLVETAGTALATKYGTLHQVITEEHGGAASLIGVVLACYTYKGDPCLTITSSEVGNSVIAGLVLVADHPQQLYVAQEDGDTSSIAVADMGLNIEAIGITADAYTGRSIMELDSNTVANTATLAFRLIGVHPDDTISAAGAAGNHCRFIVKLNTPFFGEDLTGI
jgi:hypothetical protein